MSQACWLSLSLFELTSVPMFLLLSRHGAKCVTDFVFQRAPVMALLSHFTTEPSQNQDIDLFKAEREFGSAVESIESATLKLLSVKQKGHQVTVTSFTVRSKFSPTPQPETLTLSFLGTPQGTA